MSDREPAHEADGEPAAEVLPGEPAPAAGARRTSAGIRQAAPFVIAGLIVLLAVVAGLAVWPSLAPRLAEPMRAESGDAAQVAARLDDLEARLAAQAEPPAADLRPLQDAIAAEAAARSDAIAASEARLQALQRRLEELPAASSAPGEAVQRLAARLTTVERRLAETLAPGAAMTTLREDIAATGERLARMEPELAAAAEAAGTLTALRDKLAALEQRLAAIEAGAAAAAGASRRQSLMLAVGQLAAAISQGQAYRDELARLAELADDDAEIGSAIELLAPMADRGVVGRDQLRRRFDALAGEIVRAGDLPESDGWLKRATRRVQQLVTVRRTGEVEGGESDAVVARAEVRLADGDLTGALRQLEALQGPAADAAEPWRQEAEARLLAERAIARLQARAIELLGQS